MHIAIYARVSTGRQAENDLSIPDQLRQMRQWADRMGHVVVKEYVEPGASATDDRRPVFQSMVQDAEQKPAPYQMIVVHSLSRFFRDLIQGAMYQRRLLKQGIKLVSITQQTNDDPSGDMQRHIFMLFDEYQSKENAKHTLRGMQENARKGFYNGSRAPFGYKTVEAGQSGSRGRVKKRLEIEAPEAAVVREIFDLYLLGKGGMRLGMKEIAKTLNQSGRLMRGKPWRIQKVHAVLSSPTYAGTLIFNREDSKTRQIKPESEWVKIPVPAIVSMENFQQAARLRNQFTPLKSVPRRETSTNLLTGLLRCGHCGAAMVMATGKGSHYRYYKCSNRISKGNTACKASNYPMAELDQMVLTAFRQRIFTPENIRAIISALRQHMAAQGGEEQYKKKRLETELREVEQAENRLYEAIEKGVLELDERLRERIAQHKLRQEQMGAELALLQHTLPQVTLLQRITPQKIEAVSRVLARHLATISPFSRACLRAATRSIEIKGDVLRLSGRNQSIAEIVAGNGEIAPPVPVRRSISVWRPLRPSNLYVAV